MKFRPCIDIHNGKVKQIVGGSLKDEMNQAIDNFVSEQDAAWYAELYREKGLIGGHIILLNPEGSEYYDADLAQALGTLEAFPGGLMIGGGIHSDNAMKFIRAGASHVIVTSYVFKEGKINFEHLKAIHESVGREHLVLIHAKGWTLLYCHRSLAKVYGTCCERRDTESSGALLQ